jgi:two-component system, OmpR family, phosphate regulon response regulator PhoB
MPGIRGNVLVVEDGEDMAEAFVAIVEREGFTGVVCRTAAEGLAALDSARPVAAILDWVLPDESGVELCRKIRARDQTIPILFASGRDDETSIARGLDAGADDYLAKPVRPGELIARLESHLRRVDAIVMAKNDGHAGTKTPSAIHDLRKFGAVEVDLTARSVRARGNEVALGPMEFRLLEYLVRNTGVAVSRDQIMSEVYGYDADIGTERVDVLMKRLRAKLGDHAAGGLISAVPGYGYRLEKPA